MLTLIFSWRVGLKIQQKGSPESFWGVGLNSFQELALIFSWRVGLKIQQKGSPEFFLIGVSGWPEFIPRVGLNFQLKSWPWFSAEELALKFSRRVYLNLPGWGRGWVGLYSFQELDLIFSWRVSLNFQLKGWPESFQGVGLDSFQELALIFSWRVGLKIQQKGSPESFLRGGRGGWPEFIPRVGLNFQLKSWP